MIHKNLMNRRKTNKRKVARKRRIVRDCYPCIDEWYDVNGKYVKGKIHDSNHNRTDKTNKRKNANYTRAVRTRKYGANYKPSDIKKIDKLFYDDPEVEIVAS